MRKNTSVTLGSHFEEFIDGQIAEGRFGTASKVTRSGLRILEEQEPRLESLRLVIKEGEASGHTNYLLQDLIDELDQESTHYEPLEIWK